MEVRITFSTYGQQVAASSVPACRRNQNDARLPRGRCRSTRFDVAGLRQAVWRGALNLLISVASDGLGAATSTGHEACNYFAIHAQHRVGRKLRKWQ
jgi:hypothetical protein